MSPNPSQASASGRKRVLYAGALILLGVVGRLLLMDSPNIETVLVSSLLAGYLLGGLYVVLVPVGIMTITDAIAYAWRYPGLYGIQTIVGLGLFLYSGFVFVSLLGRISRGKKTIFRTRTVAVLTTVSVLATVIYDAWTAFGDWYFISRHPPYSWSLLEVYEKQIPFTLIHLMSSLIFVPIFGSIFLYYFTQESSATSSATADEATGT